MGSVFPSVSITKTTKQKCANVAMSMKNPPLKTRLTPQQEKIIELHRDKLYHCSTEYEYIRDHRKRISELNEGYLKERGWKLVGKRCDGSPKGCKGNHSSTLYMRRAEPINPPKLNSERLGGYLQAMEDYWNSI